MRYRRFLYEGSGPKYMVKEPELWGNDRGEHFDIYYAASGKGKGQFLFSITISYKFKAIYVDTEGSRLTFYFDDRIPKAQRIQTKHHSVTLKMIQSGLLDYVYGETVKFFSRLNGTPYEEATTKIKSFTTRILKKASKARAKKDLGKFTRVIPRYGDSDYKPSRNSYRLVGSQYNNI